MLSFIQNLLEPEGNAMQVSRLLLDLLNVNVSRTSLRSTLDEHPFFPSLLSVSDSLKHFGVDNISIRFTKEDIDKLPCPFIAQAYMGKQATAAYKFSVVRKIAGEEVEYYDTVDNRWSSCSTREFIDRSSGVALLADAEAGAGEKNYQKNVRAGKIRLIGQTLAIFSIPLLLLLTDLGLAIEGASIFPLLFHFLTLVGACIGCLLIWMELDRYNPALKQICTAGKKVNCDSVLQSKGAKIFGVSWSTIGLSYFMGSLLLLQFSGITNPRVLALSGWISALAIAYIPFSLFYQWRVVKQWCLLCLLTQAVLALQFTIALLGGFYGPSGPQSIDPGLILSTAIAFLFPFLILALLIPALRHKKDSKNDKASLQRLKNNPEIFDALLSRQKTITQSITGLGIKLGNNDPRYQLLKVCNPYCAPCARSHGRIREFLKDNADFGVQIIFTASNNEGDKKTPPVRHFLAIAESNDESLTRQALDDWYNADKKDYDAFALKYPLNGKLEKQAGKIEAMNQWVKAAKITGTPTYFISRVDASTHEISYHQLPEIFTVEDLKYHFSA